MIVAKAVYSNKSFLSLSVNGHGGEEIGKDIYCAGVSACVIGALNALDAGENYQLDISSGHVDVKALSLPTKHDEIVLETLICQLDTMAKSYPERIKLIISKKEGQK